MAEAATRQDSPPLYVFKEDLMISTLKLHLPAGKTNPDVSQQRHMPGVVLKEVMNMDAINDSAEQERYDTWAVRRIMDGKKCDLVKYLRCIPSRAKDCRICYQKDVSKMEEGSEHTRMSF